MSEILWLLGGLALAAIAVYVLERRAERRALRAYATAAGWPWPMVSTEPPTTLQAGPAMVVIRYDDPSGPQRITGVAPPDICDGTSPIDYDG